MFFYSLTLIQSDRVISSKGSPPEVFYYKGFLKKFSKLTGEYSRGNTISETHLNGRVMLLKFLLPESKNVEIKKRGYAVRQMRVRRRAVYPARVSNVRYDRN